jgi:glycosyltransferase involved in cell wall biosynthesis
MSWQIPVCAMARAAVPETMDGAGVLFNDASPAEIAEALNEVIINQSLREKIIAKQNERLARFRNRDVWTEFVGLLGE